MRAPKFSHLELVSCSFTAALAAGSTAAAFTGDSLTVKNSMGRAAIVQMWCVLQADGFVQVVRPSGHDTTRDLKYRINAASPDRLVPTRAVLEVQPQETLAVTLGEAATAGDVAVLHMLMGYENLRGTTQRLIDHEEMMRRVVDFTTIEATLALTAGPAYTGEELITAESDLLKANTDYAVLGMHTNVICGALYLKGPDTGNQRIGCPGKAEDAWDGLNFFSTLSLQLGVPTIPVINSGNKASTFIGGSQDENGADPLVTVLLARLK